MVPVSQRNCHKLSARRFDLLIIGGGITGAALAWDASLRGLSVALVERGDFGAATSAATSKLIHGGLRYLKSAEIRLVRESLTERRILQAIAPHLVWPLPFMIPTYKTGNTKWLIKAGMMAYDVLSFDRNKGMDSEHTMPGHSVLSPEKVLEQEPVLEGEHLTGGAIYYDGQCWPERLTLEFLIGARELGAQCINYAAVEGVGCSEGPSCQVVVRDLLSGENQTVEAEMVANVGGPWADEVDHLFGTGEEVQLTRSKGIHIVTRSLSRSHALVLQTAAGRHFFILPWRGHSIIGTTDTRYEGAVDDLSATDEDVSELLAEINEVLPSAQLSLDDVLYRYAGVRPLVEADTQVYQASRKYEIVDHHRRGSRGLISAVGGKYTTSRNLAQKMVDRIMIHLDRPAVRCLTRTRQLPGGVAEPLGEYAVRMVEQHSQTLESAVVENLVQTYGSRMEQVLELVAQDSALASPVVPERPEIMAQLVFAVQQEQAQTLCDVLLRRTGIGTLGHPGQESLDRAADLVGQLLEWDEQRLAEEKSIFEGRVQGLPEPVRGIPPESPDRAVEPQPDGEQ